MFDLNNHPKNSKSVWNVSALIASIAMQLRTNFSELLIQGEISNWVCAASGHCYFNLKDSAAQIRCVLFRQKAMLLPQKFTNGQKVELLADVEIFETRGEMQLKVHWMRSLGEGSAFERFLQTKQKLAELGLFDTARKRPLPKFIRCIAIITSPLGAAIHDMRVSFARRAPHVRLELYPSLVQGEQAATQLITALQQANASSHAQAICLVRGGGSFEDLDAFNDELLAVAIYQSRLPVISGVGHETDYVIADFVADLRVATPTAAAELVCCARDELLSTLESQLQALRMSIHKRLNTQIQELDASSIKFKQMRHILIQEQKKLDASKWKLEQLKQTKYQLWTQQQAYFTRRLDELSVLLIKQLKKKSTHLDHCQQALFEAFKKTIATQKKNLQWKTNQLQALGIVPTLKRGYALLYNNASEVLHNTVAIEKAVQIKARVADGEVVLRYQSGIRSIN